MRGSRSSLQSRSRRASVRRAQQFYPARLLATPYAEVDATLIKLAAVSEARIRPATVLFGSVSSGVGHTKQEKRTAPGTRPWGFEKAEYATASNHSIRSAATACARCRRRQLLRLSAPGARALCWWIVVFTLRLPGQIQECGFKIGGQFADRRPANPGEKDVLAAAFRTTGGEGIVR